MSEYKILANIENSYADEFLSIKDYEPNSKKTYKLTREQFSYIGTCLEDHHAIFSAFWNLGEIIFTDMIPTACIKFGEKNVNKNFVFYFNPNFWQSLNHYTRLFAICHECLHIVFNHGYRMNYRDKNGNADYNNVDQKIKNKIYENAMNMEMINIALDLTVNHTLLNRFGFERRNITDWNKYCWVDYAFMGQKVSDNKYFEYYWGLLKSKATKMTISFGTGKNGCKTMDDHSQFGGTSFDKNNQDDQTKADETQKSCQDILDKVNKILHDEEKQKISDLLNESNNAFNKKQNDIKANGKEEEGKKNKRK